MSHTGHAEPPAGERGGLLQVMGYPLALDRLYQPDTHMWVLPAGPGLIRAGMDPLGVETSGTLAQLSFVAAGTQLAAGRPFGQLEAAKFVGPLISPVTGTLAAVNEAVVSDPGLAERDPFGAGWLIEAGIGGTAGELPGLLSDPDEITAWFAGKVGEYRLKGVLAE
jgi:glycine cleavage system H protein